jgi:hypothetical protein
MDFCQFWHNIFSTFTHFIRFLLQVLKHPNMVCDSFVYMFKITVIYMLQRPLFRQLFHEFWGDILTKNGKFVSTFTTSANTAVLLSIFFQRFSLVRIYFRVSPWRYHKMIFHRSRPSIFFLTLTDDKLNMLHLNHFTNCVELIRQKGRFFTFFYAYDFSPLSNQRKPYKINLEPVSS